ncbi:Fad/Fmn-containing dehydrogenase [Zalerion maritima]|uniref:D-arabinono-1,4-lactone oxidase n=1 Tax=Zalerion maritima TaxID=339359 RepID=A0AAD5RIF1_9PEZI|nr:Fad/Fmn-containing dehydrogenase [Zalerion maritima]
MKPTQFIAIAALWASGASTFPFNTFDGPGFPACNDVSAVYNATSVSEMVSLVQEASTNNTPVRAAGKGHMWYDTMCSSSSQSTTIIRTEFVNAIANFSLPEEAESGTVVVEAGVTFFQLADYLHERGASMGYTLVNWNITLAGAVAMGAHRSSLKEEANVAAGVLEMDIIDGNGNLRTVVRDEGSETWHAASTSLGLLGIIARMKVKVYRDEKVYAMQDTYDEADILDADLEAMIAPYPTANFWWWPYMRKFHHRYYDVIPTNSSSQEGFQSTFSVTEIEGAAAKAILESGKYLPASNWLAETIFFSLWESPNFHEKSTNEEIAEWPVYGWNHDVLIGGLYPDQKPEWDYDLHGYTLELAVPMSQANALLKRVRELFDDEILKGFVMASTYRSGINIKFGKAYFDFLGQTTYGSAVSGGEGWKGGVMMFDFPSYHPTSGDGLRYNEEFYHNLATTLIDEFPVRPHWTKNTREVFEQAKKNLDPDYIARFRAVREDFDPNGIFKSVVGEIIGLY